MMRWRIAAGAAASAAALLLAACASLPPTTSNDAPQAIASGRFAVRYPEDGQRRAAQGQFDYRRSATERRLELVSPLGQTMARFTLGAQAQLQLPDRAPLAAANATELGELLGRDALGFPVPLTPLLQWLDAGGDCAWVAAERDGWHFACAVTQAGQFQAELRRTTAAGDVALRLLLDPPAAPSATQR